MCFFSGRNWQCVEVSILSLPEWGWCIPSALLHTSHTCWKATLLPGNCHGAVCKVSWILQKIKHVASSSSIFYLICLFVCLFVCLSVGIWRANGNPNPCTDLSKEGFGASLTPRLGLGGLKPYKLKDTFLKLFTKQKTFSRLQINLGSAGYLS